MKELSRRVFLRMSFAGLGAFFSAFLSNCQRRENPKVVSALEPVDLKLPTATPLSKRKPTSTSRAPIFIPTATVFAPLKKLTPTVESSQEVPSFYEDRPSKEQRWRLEELSGPIESTPFTTFFKVALKIESQLIDGQWLGLVLGENTESQTKIYNLSIGKEKGREAVLVMAKENGEEEWQDLALDQTTLREVGNRLEIKKHEKSLGFLLNGSKIQVVAEDRFDLKRVQIDFWSTHPLEGEISFFSYQNPSAEEEI